MKRFLFSYSFYGERYGFEVPAESLQEAQHRIGAMQLARYDGELQAEIPAYPGASILVRLVTWWRNAVTYRHGG